MMSYIYFSSLTIRQRMQIRLLKCRKNTRSDLTSFNQIKSIFVWILHNLWIDLKLICFFFDFCAISGWHQISSKFLTALAVTLIYSKRYTSYYFALFTEIEGKFITMIKTLRLRGCIEPIWVLIFLPFVEQIPYLRNRCSSRSKLPCDCSDYEIWVCLNF